MPEIPPRQSRDVKEISTYSQIDGQNVQNSFSLPRNRMTQKPIQLSKEIQVSRDLGGCDSDGRDVKDFRQLKWLYHLAVPSFTFFFVLYLSFRRGQFGLAGQLEAEQEWPARQ